MVLSHNMTGLIIGLFLALASLPILLNKALSASRHRTIRRPSIESKRLLYLIVVLMVILLIAYFVYNACITLAFFERGILASIIKYLEMVFSGKSAPLEVVLGSGKAIKVNIVAPNELTMGLYTMKSRIRYIPLLLYLLLSGIPLLRRTLRIVGLLRDDKNSTSSLFSFWRCLQPSYC
jgi:hypothetical protein